MIHNLTVIEFDILCKYIKHHQAYGSDLHINVVFRAFQLMLYEFGIVIVRILELTLIVQIWHTDLLVSLTKNSS